MVITPRLGRVRRARWRGHAWRHRRWVRIKVRVEVRVRVRVRVGVRFGVGVRFMVRVRVRGGVWVGGAG